MTPLLQDPASWLRLPSWPPGWDGLHPWVVHCPMALFVTAPVFVFLAMILFHRGRWMSLTALVLLGLGLVGTSLSVSTGLAARDYLNRSSPNLSPEAAQVLEKHQQLASTLLPLYGGLFVVYLVLFLLSIAVRPFDNPVWLFFMNLVFLILLALAGLVLVNTGELGGRLVHEFGIQARIGPIRPEVEKPPAPETKPPEEKGAPAAKPEEKGAPTPKPEEKVGPKEKAVPKEKAEPEEKPTPPTEKPPEVKEKPLPEQKPTPPQEKPTPTPGEKPEKPLSSEKPKEQKPEKAGPEKPEAPAEGKPSEKAKQTAPEERPAEEKKPAEKAEHPPTEKPEEKPAEKESAGPPEKPSAKEPPPGQQKPSEQPSGGEPSGSAPKPPSSPEKDPAKKEKQQENRSPGGQNQAPPPAEDKIA